MKTGINLLMAAIAGYGLLTGCGNMGNRGLQAKVDSLETELKQYRAEKALTAQRLQRFDTLDFDFYSGQKWDSLAISHDANIKVYYPDGSTSTGLFPQHIDMLKPMFVFAPDTKITSHPVRFGEGDWTAVIGEMNGTFSRPMPIGGGKTIPPTGKPFKLSMVTIGHWKDGKMMEEYLFWDNQSFMKQIGLAK
ncbi:SnoaL-like polyketide cyclase [Chitinophaga dinghuensis]|uniref:SnoaL-like polyketide cyclase n=1 Tax=Chitinophaga dinghuensis TaxID=1539050 RepID=A0A327W9H2_9BACT|nr:ester cyclase [Chitinophaga dinghuensis]RAJ86033.1 SnoaL-like polyketide cyclase [Chitinophaga dinghuensis]